MSAVVQRKHPKIMAAPLTQPAEQPIGQILAGPRALALLILLLPAPQLPEDKGAGRHSLPAAPKPPPPLRAPPPHQALLQAWARTPREIRPRGAQHAALPPVTKLREGGLSLLWVGVERNTIVG
jgi:hypothetical protein